MANEKCCFCGKDVGKWGNDPYPACTIEGAQCCDDCNMNIVIPLRIMEVTKKEEER